MALFSRWCNAVKVLTDRKHYWTYVETDGGRDAILADLVTAIRAHYDQPERIAEDVALLGYPKASEILRASLPQSMRGRSGDLGEILATEMVEEEIGLRVPVRRLRYKDGRDMAMRGDDFIAAGYLGSEMSLTLLKGEAKSKAVLGKATVTAARQVLDRDSGRCTPSSLLFVANRLLDSEDPVDQELGRSLRNEVGLKSLTSSRIGHVLFTVSGNGPHASLSDDLAAATSVRDHYVVNLHIVDHQEFIKAVFHEAERLGDS